MVYTIYRYKLVASTAEDIANNTTRNLENTSKKPKHFKESKYFKFLILYFLLTALFSGLDSLFIL
jgi:hypothetical protein